jgi:hypothetical protein
MDTITQDYDANIMSSLNEVDTFDVKCDEFSVPAAFTHRRSEDKVRNVYILMLACLCMYFCLNVGKIITVQDTLNIFSQALQVNETYCYMDFIVLSGTQLYRRKCLKELSLFFFINCL